MSQDGEELATMQANAASVAGAVASVVTDADYAAMLAAEMDSAEYIGPVVDEFRKLREQVLNRLTGIFIDMQAAGDTAGMAAIASARTALRNVPQHTSVVGATSVSTAKIALRDLYWQISADLLAASPAAFLAFRGLDL